MYMAVFCGWTRCCPPAPYLCPLMLCFTARPGLLDCCDLHMIQSGNQTYGSLRSLSILLQLTSCFTVMCVDMLKEAFFFSCSEFETHMALVLKHNFIRKIKYKGGHIFTNSHTNISKKKYKSLNVKLVL